MSTAHQVVAVSELTPEHVPAGGVPVFVVTSRGVVRKVARAKNGAYVMHDGRAWKTPTGEILERLCPSAAAERKARAARARARREAEARAVAVKPGDVFVSSWGYSMTLVDFFEVTRVSGTRVYWRELAARKVDDRGPAGAHVVPGGAVEGGESGFSTIRALSGRPYFRIDDVRNAFAWGGTPVYYNDWD